MQALHLIKWIDKSEVRNTHIENAHGCIGSKYLLGELNQQVLARADGVNPKNLRRRWRHRSTTFGGVGEGCMLLEAPERHPLPHGIWGADEVLRREVHQRWRSIRNPR